MELVPEEEKRRDYFERSFLRNAKRFSAVFERIYFKYNREFESDEPGGKELTNEDLLYWKEEEERGAEGKRLKRGKQLSSYDMLDGVSSDSEEDSELTALLHQKVIQAKKEICWDEEEQKDRERSQLKATVRRRDDTSSSSEGEQNEVEENGRLKQRRRVRRRSSGCARGLWRKHEDCGKSSVGGDGSETLYETEYQSEYDPTQVQSDPEENGRVTPPRFALDREAYSTPRVPHKRCHSSLIRVSVIGKRLSTQIDNQAIPVAAQTEDEFVSGYDTASDYLSGPGEHTAMRDTSDSDTLEYVGTPELPPRRASPIPDILCAPPRVPPGIFDKNLTVKLQYGMEEGSHGTEEKVEALKSPNFSSESQEMADSCNGCTCHQDPHIPANGRGVVDDSIPPPVNKSHESCDSHVSSSGVSNVYTNVTYISYGHCGHTVSINQPSCFQCCSVQSYDTGFPCHHPHYPCSHPSHSHYHPAQLHSLHLLPYKPDLTFNMSIPINNLDDPTLNLSAPFGNSVKPDLNLVNDHLAQCKDSAKITQLDARTVLPLPQPKRKLDNEQSDPLGNSAAPFAKKQCR